MNAEAIQICAETIQTHSKSFSLAARLLPLREREEAFALYHWCRRADDAVDESPADGAFAVAQLRTELNRIYSDTPVGDTGLSAMQHIVHTRDIPRHYPEELLAGMAMDARDYRYETMDDLLLYCYRVAGTVGLMMTHVLGVRDGHAMRRAAHMGMAMQITNICRDVMEDWNRGRVYIPTEMLARHGAADMKQHLGGPLPTSYRGPLARVVQELLTEADRFYSLGDAGLPALSRRADLGVRTARMVYSSIGKVLAQRNYDVFAGRAYVPASHKALLVARACASALIQPRNTVESSYPIGAMRFPVDILPLHDSSNIKPIDNAANFNQKHNKPATHQHGSA